MKKFLLSFFYVTIFLSVSAWAQLRGDISTPFDYQGPIINHESVTVHSKLNKFFNSIDMSHSYSMSFGSFGGSYQSMNAYTNTMQMNITDRLDARVDLSFLHSPFGGTNMYGFNQGSPRVVLSNAELNYKFSDNAFIQIRFQQSPSHFGFGRDYGYNRFNAWYR
ncbi:MAG: hypothetical protein WC967_10915 [Balneolaceae bacterium]